MKSWLLVIALLFLGLGLASESHAIPRGFRATPLRRNVGPVPRRFFGVHARASRQAARVNRQIARQQQFVNYHAVPAAAFFNNYNYVPAALPVAALAQNYNVPIAAQAVQYNTGGCNSYFNAPVVQNVPVIQRQQVFYQPAFAATGGGCSSYFQSAPLAVFGY